MYLENKVQSFQVLLVLMPVSIHTICWDVSTNPFSLQLYFADLSVCFSWVSNLVPRTLFPGFGFSKAGENALDEVVECRAYILTRERNEENINEDDVNWGNTNSNEDMIIAVGQPNGSVKMNSANMPAAPNVWVFIAQLVGYCSSRIPLNSRSFFSG